VLRQIRQPRQFTGGDSNEVKDVDGLFGVLDNSCREQLDKGRAAQANGVTKHRVKPEEYRQLDEHGQAALERRRPVKFVQLHGFFVQAFFIVLEALLEFLKLGLQHLHLLH